MAARRRSRHDTSRRQILRADAAFEIEEERLRLVEASGDAITLRHLDAIGVVPGWRCLEVGAGHGSVARMLAERVGPNGRVVATDINPRFLSHLEASNVEVRQHNILTDPLDGPHDLVHSRYLLEHLSEPEKALRQMVRALRRPGGVLLAQASDALCFGSADDASPNACLARRLLSVGVRRTAAGTGAWRQGRS